MLYAEDENVEAPPTEIRFGPPRTSAMSTLFEAAVNCDAVINTVSVLSQLYT